MDDTDALYGLPIGEFIAARKALAKEARRAGDPKRAAEIDRMAKPSLVAWALNQLVRVERGVVDQALAAIDRQRDLQLGALTGRLDSEALRRAKAAEREAAQRLTRRAEELLAQGGQSASKGNLDRIGRALRALALDPGQRGRLERGCLVDDVADNGLEAVASELDPALLLAALEARDRPRAERPARRGVDSFLAKSVRGRGERDASKEKTGPTPRRSEVAERQARLAKARGQVDELESELASQQIAAMAAAERVALLESDIEAARLEARGAKRRSRELRERLEAARKRIRLLSS